MATVGFVVHCSRPRAATAAKEAVTWLTDRGHSPRILVPDAAEIGLAEWGFPQEDFARGLDLVVSIGGDGTMLRAMHFVVAHGVPVLGVSMGRLAYLTVVEPEDLTTALEGFLAGEHQIEERMTLAVDVEAPSGSVATGTYVACNEVVAEKPSSGHTVHVAVDINGSFFTSYAADGLIVATPTGSTAYALSARGPIISPTHRALLLTPVAPHMLFDRSLVLDAAEQVRVEVIDRGSGFDAFATPEPEYGGFGLYLVDKLADRWGVETKEATLIWFEMAKACVDCPVERSSGESPV